jgi:hypothetical protein
MPPLFVQTPRRLDIALNHSHPEDPHWVGIIWCVHQLDAIKRRLIIHDCSTSSNVHDIIHEAIENARFICEEHYDMFRGPPIQLVCPPDLTFAYVPGHLSHILFELLKVTIRLVLEYGPLVHSPFTSRTRCELWWSDLGTMASMAKVYFHQLRSL